MIFGKVVDLEGRRIVKSGRCRVNNGLCLVLVFSRGFVIVRVAEYIEVFEGEGIW